MKVKDIWTENDFEEMGWHDAYIYAFTFPNEELTINLDIDYLFDSVLDESSNLYKFWVSPCVLSFFNVLNLKIDIDFQNSIGLNILDINRNKPRLSLNGKVTLWDFEIITDKGNIKFESSGYKQIVQKQPIFIESQVITRG